MRRQPTPAPDRERSVIDLTIAWVCAASIQLTDFDGNGAFDVNYAEQDQSRMRHDDCLLRQRLGFSLTWVAMPPRGTTGC